MEVNILIFSLDLLMSLGTQMLSLVEFPIKLESFFNDNLLNIFWIIVIIASREVKHLATRIWLTNFASCHHMIISNNISAEADFVKLDAFILIFI